MRNLNRSGFSFMERLEDRVLFDAVPDGSFIVPGENADTPQIVFEQTEPLQQADHLHRELILIDAGVQGSHDLLQSILANNSDQTYEVRYVDSNSNGIEQISSILAAQKDNPYSAVHIVSHGEAGRVQLGNSFLDATSLSAQAAEVAQWGNSLTADADLLFYGCDLAGNEAGKELTSALARLTGADVAASIDLTGNERLGGDWDLEHQVGAIQTNSFKVQSWSGSLAFAIDDTNTIQADDVGSATGNVLTNDFHNGGTVTEVHAYASEVGNAFQLNYGTITLNADGSYAYDVNENHPAVIGLRVGEVLEEILSYEVSDTSSDTGVLVIRIVGVEDTLDAADDFDSVTTVVDPLATGNVITDTGSGFDIYDRGLSQLIWENEYASGAAVNGTSRTVDGITVDITTSDPDGAGSFGNQTVSYGTNGGHTGYLRHSLSGGIDPASEITTNFSFSSEVFSLSFILADIDRDQTAPISWQDQFSVVGTLGGTPVNFSALVAGTITESPSGTFYGDGSVPPSEAHGNVNIVFDGAVDSVTITYKYGPSLTTTPSGILGAVSDLTWQPPINVFVASVDGSAGNVGTPYAGQYGTFFIATDGSYTYTVDDSNPDVIALGSSEFLLDTVQYTLENTIGQTSNAVVTMTINGINEPPQLDIDASGSGTGFSTSFTEGASPVNVADTDVLITDVDNPDAGMASLTIITGSISDGAAESLTFNGDLGSSISFSMDAAAPTQQITVNGAVLDVAFDGSQFTITHSASGDITNADLQSLIAGITYNNTSPTPTTGVRTLGFVVNDGEANSNLATSSITVSTSIESAEWSLTGSTTADEGGTATYNLALNNPLRAGETAQVNIALTGVTASSNDFGNLTSAINTAIASYSGPGNFAWDGTTLTFTSDGTGVMTPLAINLGINDDSFLEGVEDFSLSISSPGSTTGENITIDAATDSVTTSIADTQGQGGPAEGPAEWSISGPATSDEGANAQYTISLSGTFGIGEVASVDVSLSDIETSSGDYASFVAAVSFAASITPGVTFNSGSGTLTFTSPSDGAAMPSLVVNLGLNDDSLLEGPEDFRISLSNAAASTGVNVAIGSNSTVTTTINDTQGDGGPTEGPGQWSISGPASRDEGATAQYTISLSGNYGVGEVAQVEVSFADISASNSDHADFTAALVSAAAAAPNVSFNSTTGILTYTSPSEGASMPDLVVDLALVNDSFIEGPENYSIGLSNATSTSGVNIGISTASVTTTINDTQSNGGPAEGPGQWRISGPASVNEGGSAQYTVSLSGSFGAGETATVELNLSAVDTDSADYDSLVAAINAAVAFDPNVTFNSGTATLTYTAPSDGASMADLIIDLGIATDGITEGDEDFALVLNNPGSTTGANVTVNSGNSSSTTTIIDSDVPNWSISGPIQSDEGSIAQYVIALSGTFGNGTQVSIDIDLTEISTNSNDYEDLFNRIATAVSSDPTLSFNTTTGTLTFTSPSGGASMSDLIIDLQLNDDAFSEGAEDFSLSLSNPASTGVSVGITTSSVSTQINDTQGVGGPTDGPGQWNLSGPNSANEGTTAQYVVSLTGTFGIGEIVTVNINSTDVTTNSSDHSDIVAAIATAAAANPNVSFNSTTGQLIYTAPADGASMTNLIIDVALTDDSFIESSESFSITLSGPGSSTGANVGLNNSTVTTTINDTQGNTGILDGPGEWSISGPINIDEGGTAQFVVALAGSYGVGEITSVDISLTNIDTNSSDYGNLITAINAAVALNPNLSFNTTTGTLTFVAPTDGATMADLLIDLPIVDDNLVEGPENLAISLSNVSSSTGANVSLSSSNFSAITTINDTNGVGRPTEESLWSISGNTTVDEGGTASYTISLNNILQSGETAQVELSLSDLETINADYSTFATAVQTAVSSRSDLSFNSTSGILTFTSAGSPMADLVVNLTANDDNFVEGPERFRVTLANATSSTGSAIGINTLQDDVTMTIQDTVGDGGANEEVVWSFSADQTVAEGGNATYTLSLGNGILQNGEQVSVDLSLIDIDTTSSDYLSFTAAVANAVAAYAGPGSLSFAAVTGTLAFVSDGNAMSDLNISLGTFDDLLAEGPEDFRIQISNAASSTGANVSIDATADDSVTTIDDRIGAGTDQVVWSITGDASVDEGGTAGYTISLIGLLASGETASVELGLSDISTDRGDYANFIAAVQTSVASRPDLSFNSTTRVLTFTGNGNTMANLVVNLAAVDDSFVEGPESFSIGISNQTSATGALVGINSLNNSVTTTIADTVGDGGATESADWSITGPANVNEGSPINYSLSLAGILQNGETATIQLTLSDIETSSADYQSFFTAVQNAVSAYAGPGSIAFNSTTGILTFTSDGNAMTDLNISLGTINDSLSEGNERLTLAISNPGSSTGASATTTASSSITTTIVDNDIAQWRISGPTQGDEGESVQYQVALSGTFGASEQTSVIINLSDISTNSSDHSDFLTAVAAAAASNSDVNFNATTNTLTYTSPTDGASMTPLVISLNLTNDAFIEGAETFSIGLSNPTTTSGITVQLDPTATQVQTEIQDTQGVGGTIDGPGEWSISGPVTINEGATAQYTISLSGQYGVGEIITVNFALSDIGTDSADYGDVLAAITSAAASNPTVTFNPTSGILTFQSPSDGASMADLVVDLPITDDVFAEGPEHFTLSLSSAGSSTGANVQIATSSATTTIDDRTGIGADQVIWSIVGDSSVDEGGTASYTIGLSGLLANGETASVELDLSNISTNSADYANFIAAVQTALASRTELTFNPTTNVLTFTGDGTAMSDLIVNLNAIDDSFVEGPESFSIGLSNQTSTTGAQTLIDSLNNSVTTTIADTIGDGGATESADWSIIGPANVNEGSPINYSLSLAGILQNGETATIQLTLSDIETSSADYQSFVAAVQNTVSTYAGPGSLAFNSTTGILTFTSDGNAMTDLNISLGTINDALSEGNERLTLAISNPGSSTGASATTTASSSITTTIVDNDIAQWSISGPTQGDEGESVQYQVALSGTFGAGEQTSIIVNLSDISTNSSDHSDFLTAVAAAAASNPDVNFNATTNTLTYTSPTDGSSMTPLVISFDLTNDAFIEGAETFSIGLTNPTTTSGITVQLDPTATQVQTEIQDTQGVGGAIDGPGEWSISGPVTINEGTTAQYTISLSGQYGAGEIITVNLALSDIGTNNADYGDILAAITSAAASNPDVTFNPTSGTLTFQSPSDGASMADLVVDLPIVDDASAEGPEDFTLSLSSAGSPTGANVQIATSSATTTIDDRTGIGADQVTWSIVGDSSVDEGGTMSYTIGLSGLLANGETASIELDLSNISTSSADYSNFIAAVQTAVSSRTELTFNPTTNVLTFTGDGTAMSDLIVNLNAIDDSFVEGPESFSIGLSNQTSTTGAQTLIDSLNDSVTTTIADTIGDGGATESADWSIRGPANVNEGSPINHSLSLAGILQVGETATIQLTLSDIETSSADYQSFVAAVQNAVSTYAGPGSIAFNSTTGVLTFTSDGNAMSDLNISLDTVNDALSEGNERLTLAISNPGSSTGTYSTTTANSSVTTTIVDNDIAQWSISGPTQGDEGESVQYQVALSGTFGAGEQTSIIVNLSDISTNSSDHSDFLTAVAAAAASNPDVNFNATINTLTYTSPTDGASMTPLVISLNLTNNDFIEGAETFSIGLSNPTTTSGITVQLDPTATQVQTEIQDTQGVGGAIDGPGEWSISGPVTINEGAIAQYTISLTGQYGVGEIITVNLALSDIGTDSADYGDVLAAITSAAASNPDVTFNPTSGILTFQSPSDGASMADLVVDLTIVDDVFAEGPEDFTLSLSSSSSSTGAHVQIANSSATTTIDDRTGIGADQVTWGLTGDTNVDEGGTPYYTISLSGLLGDAETASVELNFSDISTNSSDYSNFVTAVQNAVSSRTDLAFNSTTNVLAFTGDGTTMADLVIRIDASDDSFVEGTESFSIGISNQTSATGALVGINSLSNSVTTTIADTIGDGGTTESVDWSITGPANVNEGNPINYSLSLAGVLQNGETTTIQLTLGDIETSSADYQSFVAAVQNAVSTYAGPGSLAFNSTTGILTFTSDGNAMTDLNISLGTVNDSLSEGNERLTLALANPASPTGANTTVSSSTVTTTIVDDDVSQWSISGPTQGDEGEIVQYRVTLSGTFASGAQSSVAIDLNDITTNLADHASFITAVSAAAASRPDIGFDATTNRLTFTSPANGSTMSPLVISLELADDPLIEGSEYFSVGLSNPAASSGIAVLLDPTATHVQTEIRDTQGLGGAADGPGEWSISGPVTINEGATARYTISLTGQYGAGEIVTVDVGLSDIGTNSADYGDFFAAITAAASSNPNVTFNPTSGTLTFQSSSDGASMNNLVINLPILNDSNAEGAEDFILNLSAATSSTGANIQIGTSSTTTTISDSQRFEWSVLGSTVVPEGGYATYVLALDGIGQVGETASIDLAISNLSTSTIDYGNFVTSIQNAVADRADLSFNSATGTLTYTSDGVPMKDLVFSVQAVSDQLAESPEDFQIQLASPSSSTGVSIGVQSGNESVTTTITTRESSAGNSQPIATDDIVSTFLDTGVSGNLLSNDGSPNGNVISVVTTPVSGPNNGVVVIAPDGSFTYQPNLGFVGTDSFVYSIIDAAGEIDTAVVTIRVSTDPNGIINDNPHVVDDGGIGQKNEPILGDLLANDSDPNGDSITINATPVSGPSNGTLTINANGTYTYTPNNDFVGTDSFVYEACDAFGNCETAVVHLTVFDSPPVALDDINHTATGLPLTGNVLTNDSDPNPNDTISVNSTPITGPSNGSLALASDGTYTYTPNANFSGTDTFTYEVCDELGNCDIGTVTIEVRDAGATNAPPVANSDSAVVFQNGSVVGHLLSNDGDPTGDTITLRTTPVTNPTNGTVTIGSNGIYTYTPNPGFLGTDSFEYEICDDQGACASAIVTINVIADGNGTENNAPHGGNDSILGQKNVPYAGDLVANDFDPNNDPLTINTIPVAPPSNGNLVINPDGTFTYVPHAGFTGNDSFQYEVCDDQGACTIVTAVITIFNEPPVAVDDQFNVTGDSVTGNVAANDSDPNGDPITATLVVPPQHGSITWQSDGTFTFTPGPTYTGNDSFVYIICDDSGACATASVQLTSPFAFDSFNNQATDDNVFDKDAFEFNNRNRELLLSHRIGSLAPEPILAGYATPGSVLIGRIYNAHGALVAETTTHASPAGNWVMHFFDAEIRSHYVVMIEHIATEEIAMGNHHFRLTPTTYRSLQLGANHTDAATIGTILSDLPSNALDIWHQQNVNPLRFH